MFFGEKSRTLEVLICIAAIFTNFSTSSWDEKLGHFSGYPPGNWKKSLPRHFWVDEAILFFYFVGYVSFLGGYLSLGISWMIWIWLIDFYLWKQSPNGHRKEQASMVWPTHNGLPILLSLANRCAWLKQPPKEFQRATCPNQVGFLNVFFAPFGKLLGGSFEENLWLPSISFLYRFHEAASFRDQPICFCKDKICMAPTGTFPSNSICHYYQGSLNWIQHLQTWSWQKNSNKEHCNLESICITTHLHPHPRLHTQIQLGDYIYIYNHRSLLLWKAILYSKEPSSIAIKHSPRSSAGVTCWRLPSINS